MASVSSFSWLSRPKVTTTVEKPSEDRVWTCFRLGRPLSAAAIGCEMSRSTTSGPAPGSAVTMKTEGKLMSGSSSWLRLNVAKTPAPIIRTATRMTTGRLVRHQRMIARTVSN